MPKSKHTAAAKHAAQMPVRPLGVVMNALNKVKSVMPGMSTQTGPNAFAHLKRGPGSPAGGHLKKK